MPDEDKTFSGSLVLDLRILWRHMHTLLAKKPMLSDVKTAFRQTPEICNIKFNSWLLQVLRRFWEKVKHRLNPGKKNQIKVHRIFCLNRICVYLCKQPITGNEFASKILRIWSPITGPCRDLEKFLSQVLRQEKVTLTEYHTTWQKSQDTRYVCLESVVWRHEKSQETPVRVEGDQDKISRTDNNWVGKILFLYFQWKKILHLLSNTWYIVFVVSHNKNQRAPWFYMPFFVFLDLFLWFKKNQSASIRKKKTEKNPVTRYLVAPLLRYTLRCYAF